MKKKVNEEMDYADAVIILAKWKELKDEEFVPKRIVNDFVRAMFKVYGGRNAV
jgi:hypothetical protein